MPFPSKILEKFVTKFVEIYLYHIPEQNKNCQMKTKALSSRYVRQSRRKSLLKTQEEATHRNGIVSETSLSVPYHGRPKVRQCGFHLCAHPFPCAPVYEHRDSDLEQRMVL